MIDLEHAAEDLIAAGRAEPDLERLRDRVGRRRTARRAGAAAAALVVLIGGAALARAATGDGAEAIHTGPGPERVETGPTAPEAGTAATQAVDLGGLRVRVPSTWRIADGQSKKGVCGGSDTVAIGPPPDFLVGCPTPNALRLSFLEEPLDGGGEDPQTRNGIALVRLNDDPEVWAAPDLGIRLAFGPESDPDAILDSVEPSARQVSLADLRSGAAPRWQTDPEGWKVVRFDGGALRVPAAWPLADAVDNGRADPCTEWATDPSVVLGGNRTECAAVAPGAPGDGVWVLPLAGTSAESVSAAETIEIDGVEVRVLSYASGTVLEAYPVDADPGVLLRIGLGEDGHVAASILSSLRLGDDAPEPDPEIGAPVAIVLPCGVVAVPNRSLLELPEDLVVDPQPGMGGWAPGTDDGICAVNLTDPEDPATHVTFAAGSLPYGLGEELGGEATRAAGVRWGTIEDGFGGELTTAGGDTVHVLAYGLSEEGAALLFASLAAT